MQNIQLSSFMQKTFDKQILLQSLENIPDLDILIALQICM